MLKKEFMLPGQKIKTIRKKAPQYEYRNGVKVDVNGIWAHPANTPSWGNSMYIPPDTELEVVTGPPNVVVKYNGVDHSIPQWTELKNNAEHIGDIPDIGDQFSYAIRDRSTGKFYVSTNTYAYSKYTPNKEYAEWDKKRNEKQKLAYPEWVKWVDANPAPEYSAKYIVQDGVDPFVMAEKITKAKKYDDLGKLKSGVLYFTAYRSEVEGEKDYENDDDDYTPEWLENRQSFPFLPTFEAVKINKSTREIVEVIDLQTWYANLLRLRVLTKEYGSTVRNLYKRYEASPENWGFIITFKGVDIDKEIAIEHTV